MAQKKGISAKEIYSLDSLLHASCDSIDATFSIFTSSKTISRSNRSHSRCRSRR